MWKDIRVVKRGIAATKAIPLFLSLFSNIIGTTNEIIQITAIYAL